MKTHPLFSGGTPLALLPLLAAGNLSAAAAPAPLADDFNDNSTSSTQWGADFNQQPAGTLTETNQRLEYTATASSTKNLYRPCILDSPTYERDWETVVDASNLLVPESGDNAGLGILVRPQGSNTKFLFWNLSMFQNGSNTQRAFYSSLNEESKKEKLTSSPRTALRIAFDAASKSSLALMMKTVRPMGIPGLS